MDEYLKRFERFAENAGWYKTDWATDSSAFRATPWMHIPDFSPTDSLDHDKYKDASLKRFQLTEEGFRLKFRSSKPELGETLPQFVVRLDDYLTRWKELAKMS